MIRIVAHEACAACEQAFSAAVSLGPDACGVPTECDICREQMCVAYAEMALKEALEELGPEAVLRGTRNWCKERVGLKYTSRERVFGYAVDRIDAILDLLNWKALK